MLPRLDATVAPLTAADAVHGAAPIGDGRQAAFQRSLQALVGQSLQAQVLSRYSDGSFLVRVADNAARMLLPAGVQVGSEVPLTVLAAQPRPTFQLANAAGTPATVVYSDAAPSGADGEAQLYHPTLPDPAATAAARLPGAASPAPGAAPGAGAQAGLTGAPPGAGAQAGQAGAPPGAGAQTAAGLQATLQPGAAAVPAGEARPASAGAALLARAPLIPSSALPALDATTPPPTLSTTARVLTAVLTAAPGTPAGAPVVLTGKTALVAAGAPPEPEQLAQRLQTTIGHSGLFYESHVADWVKGERTLPELMQEPQMQRQQQAAADGAARAQAGPDLSAALLINQQLHAHEQARVQWQGEAWPGQPMQWEVRREQRDDDGRRGQDGRDGADGQPEPVWRSGVRFRFPLLGKVAATVTVAGDQVQIQVQTGSDQSAVTLRAYAGLLEQAMAAAGSPLSSLTIGADTGAGDEP